MYTSRRWKVYTKVHITGFVGPRNNFTFKVRKGGTILDQLPAIDTDAMFAIAVQIYVNTWNHLGTGGPAHFFRQISRRLETFSTPFENALAWEGLSPKEQIRRWHDIMDE
jgi:hypothetical protein